jgi:hypothetical protein
MRPTVLNVLPILLALAVSPAAAQQPRDSLRIVFVGDINFARSLARNYLFQGRGAEVLAGVRDELRGADIAVGNLESILLDRGRHADTTNSPVFAGPVTEAMPLLHDAGFDFIGTANNHAWDFRRAGLLENLMHLDSAGIPHNGTGANLGDAWRPVVIRMKGWTVAFFSMTAIFNNPYTLSVIGSESECCVAWADTLRAAERFRTVRDSVGADLVIAYIHAGMEYRPVPEPDVVIRFRALVRAGADAVIGHHPHVPQGIEWLDGKPIVYSLGNFVFKQNQRWTNRGLWAELTFTDRESGVGNRESNPRTGTDSRFPIHDSRLLILPLVVGYTPTFARGVDSLRVMQHVDSISRRIPANPRLPNPRPGRNISNPRTPRTRNP